MGQRRKAGRKKRKAEERKRHQYESAPREVKAEWTRLRTASDEANANATTTMRKHVAALASEDGVPRQLDFALSASVEAAGDALAALLNFEAARAS